MGIIRSPENTLIELVGITSFKSVLQLAGDTASKSENRSSEMTRVWNKK